MRIFLSLALCASSLVAGCASSANTARLDEVDSDRVAAVNRVASGHGVEVHWVSYPRRRTADGAPAVAPVTPDESGSPRAAPVGT